MITMKLSTGDLLHRALEIQVIKSKLEGHSVKNIAGSCEGGCSCGFVRYKLVGDPLIVHCCHCRYCQRQTGSSFALNALYDASKVEVLSGTVDRISVPTPTGDEQIIARCPKCEIAVWSNYLIMGVKDLIHFVRVGTLDNPDLFPPDAHIYTESKQPWVVIPPDDLAVKQFYDYETTWSDDNRKIFDSLLARAKALDE